MALHRVRIRLEAPLGTPLHSGTLFGHLCWARREMDGEAALVAWLSELPSAPWALSDGFPPGLLPRPLLRARIARPTQESWTIEELEERKRTAKYAWIDADAWRRLRAAVTHETLRPHLKGFEAILRARRGGERNVGEKEFTGTVVRIAHNRIDRCTGSTPEEGGLYFVDEDWSYTIEGRRDIYLRAPADANEIRSLFEVVGETGFGRDATWGRGTFAVEDIAPADWLDETDGNRLMSLSHGVLTENMDDPRYRLETHFGKLGVGMLHRTAVPWKRPILLARPGCTFQPRDAGPYGAWLVGKVHQKLSEAGHNAFHLAIPYREGEAGT